MAGEGEGEEVTRCQRVAEALELAKSLFDDRERELEEAKKAIIERKEDFYVARRRVSELEQTLMVLEMVGAT